MTDEELKELVVAWGFGGDTEEMAVKMAQDIRRRVNARYFSFMQHANNAALDGTVTPRELDMYFWKVASDKQFKQ